MSVFIRNGVQVKYDSNKVIQWNASRLPNHNEISLTKYQLVYQVLWDHSNTNL